MRRIVPIIILTFFINTLTAFATQPDSIVINDNSWAFLDSYQYKYVLINTGKKFDLYKTYKHTINNKGEKISTLRKKIGTVPFDKISLLINAFNDTSFSNLSIQNFGYDKQWILSNSDKLFNYIKKENHHWIPKQREYAREQLSNIENYEFAIKRVVGQEGIYILAKDGGTGFLASFYYKNKKTLEITANENPFGMPWQIDSLKSYNPIIPKIFADILPNNDTYNKSRFNNFANLMPELAKSIYEDKCQSKMYDLASLEFEKEINELKSKYRIVSAAEYGYGDGYIWEQAQVIKIKLKDTLMLPNVCIDLYLTREGNTLHSRDSIMAYGNDLVQSVQNIPFIKKYLLADTSRKLMVDFDNDASINDHVIDGFNKSPKDWLKYENDVKQRDWMDSMKIELSTSREDDLKTSRQIYCGCNFRLDNNFLKRGIHFVIHDERNDNWSTWIMLPDSTIILWYISGGDFSELGCKGLDIGEGGMQYPCKKIDNNGNVQK